MRSIMCFVCLFLLTTIFVSCSSSPESKKEESKFLQEMELVKQEKASRHLEILSEALAKTSVYGDEAINYVKDNGLKLVRTMKSYKLDTFKESPNKEIEVPSDVARLHIKNNYPSGNFFLFLISGANVIVEEIPFNTEKKIDLKPAAYEIAIIIDRKFNNNEYLFGHKISLKGGKLYLGEFNIFSKMNKGDCPEGEIADDDMCINPMFKPFDNCGKNKHLVENLCCEEGFNFIMDGECSRYSDAVESVVCPMGFHPSNKGRCCPNGKDFIDGMCRDNKVNKNGDVKKK